MKMPAFSDGYYLRKDTVHENRSKRNYTDEEEQLISDYAVWLHKQPFVSGAVLTRFINNLASEMGYEQTPVFLKETLAHLLGYKSFLTLRQHANTFDWVRKQAGSEQRLEKLRKQGFSDFAGFFFTNQPQYAEMILDYLMIKVPHSERIDTPTFFKRFGPIFQCVLMIPDIRTSGIPEDTIKDLSRRLFAWHLRSHIPADLMLKQCAELPKAFRVTYYNFQAQELPHD